MAYYELIVMVLEFNATVDFFLAIGLVFRWS
jgi:hypothetical protein